MRAAIVALLVAATALAAFPAPSRAEPIASERIEVVDGQTIRVDGETFRLPGLIAPKVGKEAGCDAERRAGERAAQRLRRIVADGGLDLQRTRCNGGQPLRGPAGERLGRRAAADPGSSRDPI